METYVTRSHLFEDPTLQLEVFEAWSTSLHKDVLLKSYKRDEISSAEGFLKEAIRLSLTGPIHNCRVCDLVLRPEQGCDTAFTAYVVFEKLDHTPADVVMRRDDSGRSLPLDDFNSSTVTNRLTLAWSRRLHRTVVMKSYPVSSILDLDRVCRQALTQAIVSANCPKNAKLLGAIFDSSSKLTVVTFMEKLNGDMQKDIERRVKCGKRFTEEELLDVLSDVSEGLISAKKMVRCRQGIAHGSITPASLYLSPEGGLKVGDYSNSQFSPNPLRETPLISEICETRVVQTDPHQSDVFSLGITILQLANLSYPERLISARENLLQIVREETESLDYSADLKQLLRDMLESDPTLRFPIEAVYSKAKTIRRKASFEENKASTTAGSDARLSASAELESAQNQKLVFHYRRALELLQSAWETLHSNGVADTLTVAVGLALSEVLGVHLSQFDEAERILQCSLRLATAVNSEDVMKLCSVKAAVHFHNAEWTRCEAASIALLETLSRETQHEDMYWISLYYLTLSLREQSKSCSDATKKWLVSSLCPGSPLTQFLTLCIRALVANAQEAESLYREAAQLATARFPASIYAGTNWFYLGVLCAKTNRAEDARSSFTEADALFSTHYPGSIYAGWTLTWLGEELKVLVQRDEAVRKLQQAHQVLSRYHSASIYTAANLGNLALLLWSEKRLDEAERTYQQACHSYAAHHPTSDEAAMNLYSISLFYEKKNSIEQAVSYAISALEIWTRNKAANAKRLAVPLLERLGRARKQ